MGRQDKHGVMEKTVNSRTRENNVGKRLTGLNWEWLWERTSSKIWFWGLNMKKSEVGYYLGDQSYVNRWLGVRLLQPHESMCFFWSHRAAEIDTIDT